MMKQEIKMDVIVKIKADYSWFTALKLRLSGASYIKDYINEVIKKSGIEIEHKVKEEETPILKEEGTLQ